MNKKGIYFALMGLLVCLAFFQNSSEVSAARKKVVRTKTITKNVSMRIGGEKCVTAGMYLRSKKVSKKGIVTVPSVKQIKKDDGLAMLKAKKAGTSTVTLIQKEKIKKKKKVIIKKTIRKYKVRVYDDPTTFGADFSKVASITINDLYGQSNIKVTGDDMQKIFGMFDKNASYQKEEILPDYITQKSGNSYYGISMYSKDGKELYDFFLLPEGYFYVYAPVRWKGYYKNATDFDYSVIANLYKEKGVRTVTGEAMSQEK